MRGLKLRWEAIGRFSKWVSLVGKSSIFGLYCSGIWSYDRPSTIIYGYTPVALVCGALLCLAQAPQRHLLIASTLGNSVPRFFGKYSYSAHLMHLTVRALIRDAVFSAAVVHGALGSGLFYQFVFYATVTPTLIPLAQLSWKVLESHFLSLTRFFPEYQCPR